MKHGFITSSLRPRNMIRFVFLLTRIKKTKIVLLDLKTMITAFWLKKVNWKLINKVYSVMTYTSLKSLDAKIVYIYILPEAYILGVQISFCRFLKETKIE